MTDEESRVAYWDLVRKIQTYAEESGRSIEDILEEFDDDCF